MADRAATMSDIARLSEEFDRKLELILFTQAAIMVHIRQKKGEDMHNDPNEPGGLASIVGEQIDLLEKAFAQHHANLRASE